MKHKLASEAVFPNTVPDKGFSAFPIHRINANIDEKSLIVNTPPAAPNIISAVPTALKEDLTEKEDTISTSLFDLSADELAKLYAMEEEITKVAESREVSPNGSHIAASMKEIAAIEQAEKSLTALESGSVEHAEIAKLEEEMAAIEAALMEQMPSQFASLEEFMAEEIADGQKDMTNDDIMSMDLPLIINE